jgi:hypothetical protein
MKPPFSLYPKLLLWMLALAFLLGPASSNGQSAVGDAVATLGPDNERVRLPGAQVAVRCEHHVEKRWAVVTDENGRFSVPGLPIDKCSATASAQGFRSETKVVRTADNSAVELSFQLQLLTVPERRQHT